MLHRTMLAVCVLVSTHMALAQDEDIYELSLEDLLSTEIYSVSKKAESIIDAPLSSSTISKDEIANSGATTLEEVFRLIPGVIVREETNGNFDIHIRGLDNMPQGAFSPATENVSTLVMIDGRRVYNTANGGTFLETLPVSLTDIEQIEVIRGPAQALYGPNAASGVINIITTSKNADGKPFEVFANASAGNYATTIANASLGWQVNDKLNIRSSFNIDQRERADELYYNYVTGEYGQAEEVIDWQNPSFTPINPSRAQELWSDRSLAKDKLGANLYATYVVNEDVSISATIGYQDSDAQTIFFESTTTPITPRSSSTTAIDLRTTIHGLSAQFSLLTGEQAVQVGQPYDWDLTSQDATLEYEFLRNNENLSIRPGVQYQISTYDDTGSPDGGLFNSKKNLINQAAFVKIDANPLDNLRLIGAIRLDAYNEPDDQYVSYQFASTYRINDKNLVRAVVSRAYRGSTIAQMYLDFADGTFDYTGNTDLDLMQVDLFEVGIRNTIGESIQTNFELFYSVAEDFSELQPSLVGAQPTLSYINYPTVAKQTGLTAEVTWVPNSKLRTTVFGTFQSTDVEDALRSVPDATYAAVGLSTTTETFDTESNRTPSFYGGFKLSYLPIDKLTIFTNLYYFGENEWVYFDQLALPKPPLAPNGFNNIAQVDAKARLDFKVAYNVWERSSIYFNARNALNNESDEFGFSDNIPGLYLFGLDVRL